MIKYLVVGLTVYSLTNKVIPTQKQNSVSFIGTKCILILLWVSRY